MLISKENTCLIIFSMQREFIPSLKNGQNLIDSCCWLVDLAQHFNVPVFILNHKDLGTPISSIKNLAQKAVEIELTNFSCLEDDSFQKIFNTIAKTQFLLAGAESHISIFQSAISFKERDKNVFVIADAILARNEIDHNIAMKRLTLLNIPLITKEMVFFEFIRQSQYPNYIDMSLKFLDGRYIRE
jgi:nicotinamidase-related amidase